MAGGSPFELFNIFGLQVQRYKVVMYMLGLCGATYAGAKAYGSLKPTPQPVFESKDQKDWIKKYMDFTRKENEKPELLRTPFRHPTSDL